MLAEEFLAWFNALLCLEILNFLARDLHFRSVLDPVDYVLGPVCISLTGWWTALFHIGHHGQRRNPRGKIGTVLYSVQPPVEKATFFLLNRTDMKAASDLNWVGTFLITHILHLWSWQVTSGQQHHFAVKKQTLGWLTTTWTVGSNEQLEDS